MKQPVRKTIAESHPESAIKPIYTLLVDGGNLLRISFADNKTNSQGVHYGGVFQFLLQLRLMLQKKVYDYIYVFFDDEDSGILRYRLYNEYKANRDKKYQEHDDRSEYAQSVDDLLKKWKDKHSAKPKKEKTDEQKLVDENFARERDILFECFNELYIRWIFNSQTEGDDFIAYYVQHKKPEENVVIMSTDQDLTQLISDTVCVYDHKLEVNRTYEQVQKYNEWYQTLSKEEKKEEREKEKRRKKDLGVYLNPKNFKKYRGIPYENIVIKKIFCGDSSDNIGNIKGLSEDRLFELMPEIKERPITVEEVKERAKQRIDERVGEKKQPLQWHQNIVDGISNKDYNGDFYDINRKIIDLSKPLLTEDGEEEIKSMMYEVQDSEGRSFGNLYKIIVNEGIEELMNEKKFANFFEPFKPFIDKEISRFKKNTN